MATVSVLILFLSSIAAIQANYDPYITGGADATVGAWPWQGSIQYMFGKLHMCGSAIISDRFILTAANCVANSPFAYHLIAGLHNTKDWSKGKPEKHHFYSVQKHPDFDKFRHDLSVIELHPPVLNMSNPYIDKVAMAPKGADYVGKTCYMTGWGAMTKGSVETAGVLQQAAVTVLTTAECKAVWGDVVFDDHICIKGKGANAGICKGDSGSPLVCQNTAGTWELAGIASFGDDDCEGSKPSVFTRVSEHRDWISKETGGL